MSSHDEYSSDEEDLVDENQKSDVFLGFVDAPIIYDDDEQAEDDEDAEEPTIEDTFIGGKPVWLHPESFPDEKFVCCENCGKKMALLLQAFAPIDGKLYDRVIYIFGCKNTSQCSKKKGSIKAIRGISKDPERVAEIKKEQEEAVSKDLDAKLQLDNQKKLQIELTKDLFSSGTKSGSNDKSVNPFASSDSSNPFASSSGANPFGGNAFAAKKEETPKETSKKEVPPKESYASIASKNTVKSKKQSEKSQYELPYYSGNFLYVDRETFKKETNDPELEKYRHLIDMDVNKDDEGSSSGKRRGSSSSGAGLDPSTAKISSMLDDKYFENFSNTVKHNPGQVLRYNLGGNPLLYSGRDEIAKKFAGGFNVPKPAFNPSSERQFELQLMPKAIMDLEQINDEDVKINDILNGMSWGTIIVCTDVEDYVPESSFDDNQVAYIEEWCGVQWEESV
ncbi:programmed cell death protein 2 [Scheffersomyces xylosifermentans]|uniref:programmed cell death protein 2 n=1 Tax=Scheffersomyces xylosifermentans TaxID=1304137 RepID=UPI00315C971D